MFLHGKNEMKNICLNCNFIVDVLCARQLTLYSSSVILRKMALVYYILSTILK